MLMLISQIWGFLDSCLLFGLGQVDSVQATATRLQHVSMHGGVLLLCWRGSMMTRSSPTLGMITGPSA